MPARKLLLVDGSSYLYRAFHALPPLSNSKGEPTGAVLGVINMLNKLMKEESPDRVAVVFDAPGRTFRDELFDQYKAHRTPMPDDLRSQLPPLLEAVAALGLPLLRVAGVEADDVIGTLAVQGAAAGFDVLISTGDKDMAQLVDPRISLVNTMSNTRLDRAGVKAKFDVFPEQIVDYLALVGDSSDNIPGITGVGPKTAAKWLNQYQTLDALVARAADIPGKVGENLRGELPALELSRKLATIDAAVSLAVTPEDLVAGSPDLKRLRELYGRLELRALAKSLDALSPSADTGTATSAAAGSLRRAWRRSPLPRVSRRRCSRTPRWTPGSRSSRPHPSSASGSRPTAPITCTRVWWDWRSPSLPGTRPISRSRMITPARRRSSRSIACSVRSSRCSRTPSLPRSAGASSSMPTSWRTTASRSKDSVTIRCSSRTCSTASRPATTWSRPPRNTSAPPSPDTRTSPARAPSRSHSARSTCSERQITRVKKPR